MENIAVLDNLSKFKKCKQYLTLTQKVEPTKPLVDRLDLLLTMD